MTKFVIAIDGTDGKTTKVTLYDDTTDKISTVVTTK